MTHRDLLTRAHPNVCTLLCRQSHETEHAPLCREIDGALIEMAVEELIVRQSHAALDAAGVPQGGALTTRIGLLVQQFHSLQTECGHREADCRELEARLADKLWCKNCVWHLCVNGTIRPYPNALCSSHARPDDATNVKAVEVLRDLQARLAAAEQREQALREALEDIPGGIIGSAKARVFSDIDGDDENAAEYEAWFKQREAALSATQPKEGSDG